MGNCYPSASALPTPPGMEISIDAIQLPCMLCKRQFSPECTFIPIQSFATIWTMFTS